MTDSLFGFARSRAVKAVGTLIFLYATFWVLYGMFFGGLFGAENSIWAIVGDNAFEVFIIFVLLTYAKLVYSITTKDVGISSDEVLTNVLIGVIAGSALYLGDTVLSQTIVGWVPHWMTVPEEWNYVSIFTDSDGIRRVVLFISYAIATPFLEEILFRGLLQTILGKAFSRLSTITLSASIFAGFHIFPEPVLVSFVIGLGLAWLREERNSLIAPITSHVLVNSTILCLT